MCKYISLLARAWNRFFIPATTEIMLFTSVVELWSKGVVYRYAAPILFAYACHTGGASVLLLSHAI